MGKTYLSRFFFFLVIGWWSLLDVEATAYSLRQFSSKNGLSNSAILSICQDCDGLIWIGSCDGLNVFEGLNSVCISLLMSGTICQVT